MDPYDENLTANPEEARLRTDSLFYRLFQDWTGLVPELASLEPTAGYTCAPKRSSRPVFSGTGCWFRRKRGGPGHRCSSKTQFQYDPRLLRPLVRRVVSLPVSPTAAPGRWRCPRPGETGGWEPAYARLAGRLGHTALPAGSGVTDPPSELGHPGGLGLRWDRVIEARALLWSRRVAMSRRPESWSNENPLLRVTN